MGAGYSFKAKANKSAEILIYEDIGSGWFGGVTAKQFAGDLKAAGQIDTLDVRLASYGGDIIDGMAIYRLLAEHKARKVMHVDSVAASIASVIAMAGDEIVIAESASIMIHEAWTIAAGNADSLQATVEQLRSTSKQIEDIYVARTGKPSAQVAAWMKAETWMYGQEAVDKGFATSVAQNVRMAASASSMWQSVMRGRIAQIHHQAEHQPEPGQETKPNAANDDVRAHLASLTERMRARHLTPVR